jgi:hypothetical protein
VAVALAITVVAVVPTTEVSTPAELFQPALTPTCGSSGGAEDLSNPVADLGEVAASEDEYKPVTDSEWSEFAEHFDRRKVELGGCARPYGSACQHEHACLSEMILVLD